MRARRSRSAAPVDLRKKCGANGTWVGSTELRRDSPREARRRRPDQRVQKNLKLVLHPAGFNVRRVEYGPTSNEKAQKLRRPQASRLQRGQAGLQGREEGGRVPDPEA